MPKVRAPFDIDRYQALKAEGYSNRQIAQELAIPESTLRDNLKVLQPAPTLERGPLVDVGTPHELPEVHVSPPNVHLSAQDRADLQALLAWWRDRQRLVADAAAPGRELVRQTYHIEQRFIDAVRRESDLTGESYAAIVNRAFARYFGATST